MTKCKVCGLLEENCTCFNFVPWDRLTPPEAIEALEKRFELGEKTHSGGICWNANTKQEQLSEKDWILDRLIHGSRHMIHFADVMAGRVSDDGDDDGAAIMWLGCMLHMAYLRRKSLQKG